MSTHDGPLVMVTVADMTPDKLPDVPHALPLLGPVYQKPLPRSA